MTASYTCLECGHAFQSARPVHGEACPHCESTLLEDSASVGHQREPVEAFAAARTETLDDLSSDEMKAMLGPTV